MSWITVRGLLSRLLVLRGYGVGKAPGKIYLNSWIKKEITCLTSEIVKLVNYESNIAKENEQDSYINKTFPIISKIDREAGV